MHILVNRLHARGTLGQAVVVQLDGVTHRAEWSVADERETGLGGNNGLASNKCGDSTNEGEGKGGGLQYKVSDSA